MNMGLSERLPGKYTSQQYAAAAYFDLSSFVIMFILHQKV